MPSHSKSSLDRVRQFLGHDVWMLSSETMKPSSRAGLLGLQQLLLVVRHFNSDRCLMRAAALTYTTMLALVPFLALVFAVMKGFGVQNMLEPLLLEQLAVGGQEAVSAVVGYINNTSVARLGVFGFLLLLVTVYGLLSQVEKSFNAVCGAGRNRSPFRRFADYFSVGILGLLFLVAAISMTTTLKNQAIVQRLLEMDYIGQIILLSLKLTPFVVMWLAFMVMYLFMPNVTIRFHAALVGGLIGGTLWQVAQYAYIGLQVGVAKYNAIYGTLAALPILMIWIQLSWIIVLLGLEVVYVVQNFQTIRPNQHEGRLSPASSEVLALVMLLRIGHYFNQGQAPRLEQLAGDIGVPSRQMQQMMEQLETVGLVNSVALDDEGEGFQLAMAPDKIRVAEALHRLHHHGVPLSTDQPSREQQFLAQQWPHHASTGEFEQMSLSELVAHVEAASSGE